MLDQLARIITFEKHASESRDHRLRIDSRISRWGLDKTSVHLHANPLPCRPQKSISTMALNQFRSGLTTGPSGSFRPPQRGDFQCRHLRRPPSATLETAQPKCAAILNYTPSLFNSSFWISRQNKSEKGQGGKGKPAQSASSPEEIRAVRLQKVFYSKATTVAMKPY
jgi:hypothetical protein